MDKSTRSGFNNARIVHVHPTAFCNLYCKHCYSSSGPSIKHHLDIQRLVNSLKILRGEGYGVLSISGGEPLLYKHIETLLRKSKKLGYKINIISNGAPINKSTINLIKDYVNLTAISLDGIPSFHNYIRNNENAFRFAENGINKLISSNLKTGIAYGVSSKSIEGMPWAIEFAEKTKCSLIQFHPFAAIGRGKLMPELILSKEERARAFIIANLFKSDPVLQVKIDLISSSNAVNQKDDYPILKIKKASNLSLSDIVNPIIISDEGNIFPFCFGIHASYKIANLDANVEEQIAAWKKTNWTNIQKVIQSSFDNLDDEGEDFIDWFLHILNTSTVLVKSGSL